MKSGRKYFGLAWLLIVLVALLAACAGPGEEELEEPTGSDQAAPEQEEPEEGGPEEDGGIEQDPTGGDRELPAIVPETTKAVEGAITGSLEEISPEGMLTFRADTAEAEAFLTGLEAGHVLAGEVSEAAPDGFLRKVAAVNRSGNRFEVATVEASLEDAFEQGVIEFSRELTEDDLAELPAGEGIRLAKRRPGQASKGFTLRVDNVRLADKVFADVKVEVEAKYDYKVRIKGFRIEQVLFTSVISEKTTLELRADIVRKGLKVRQEINPIPMKSITIRIKGIPVTIRPQLTLVVGLNGDVSANITTSVVHEGEAHTGVQYDRTATPRWTVQPATFPNTFTFNPPQLAANARLKAYAGPRLELLLFGRIGPHVEPDGYLELTADVLKDPWWALKGGLEVEIGVKIDLKGLPLAGALPKLEFSRKVFEKSWPIADAGGPVPGLPGGGPPPAPPAVPDQMVGRVLWGSGPMAGVGVEVKPPGDFYSQPVLANGVTDAGGGFSIDKLPPGSYVIYAIAPAPEFWDFSGYPLDIPPGSGDINVGDLNISQRMRLLDPPDGSVIATRQPTLRWDPFPGAAFYQVTVLDGRGRDVVRDSTAGTSYTPPVNLQRGMNYEWFVEAMDGSGSQIAYFASWFFTVRP